MNVIQVHIAEILVHKSRNYMYFHVQVAPEYKSLEQPTYEKSVTYSLEILVDESISSSILKQHPEWFSHYSVFESLVFMKYT